MDAPQPAYDTVRRTSQNDQHMTESSLPPPDRDQTHPQQSAPSEGTGPNLFRYLSQQGHGSSPMPPPPASMIVPREPQMQQVPVTKPRSSQACDVCRRRKVKCDQLAPCTACARSGHPQDCIFSPPAQRRTNKYQHVQRSDSEPNLMQGPYRYRSFNDESQPTSAGPHASMQPARNSPYQYSGTNPPAHGTPVLANGIKRSHDGSPKPDTPYRRTVLHDTAPPTNRDLVDRTLKRRRWDGTVVVKGSKTKYRSPYGSNALIEQILPEFRQCMTTIVREPEIREKLNGLRRVLPKSSRSKQDDSMSDQLLLDSIPAKAISDRLFETFFATYGSVLHLVDRSTIQSQYQDFWDHAADAPAVVSLFALRLILLMLVASEFDLAYRMSATHKIGVCDAIDSRLRRMRGGLCYTKDFLEAHCLLHVARQTTQQDAGASVRATRELITIAMTLGLHQDSETIPGLSHEALEKRRNTWVAVLELDIQASLSAGMPPGIRDKDLRLDKNFEVSGHTALHQQPVAPEASGYWKALQNRLGSSLRPRTEVVDGLNDAMIPNSCLDSVTSAGTIEFLSNDAHREPDARVQCARIIIDLWYSRPYLASLQLLSLQDPDNDLNLKRSHTISVNLSMSVIGLLDAFDPEVTELPAEVATAFWQHLVRVHFATFLQAAYILCLEIEMHEKELSSSSHTKASILHALNRLLSSLIESGPDLETHIKDLIRLAALIQFVRSRGQALQKQDVMRQALHRVIGTSEQRCRSESSGSSNAAQLAEQDGWSEAQLSDDLFDWSSFDFDFTSNAVS